MVGNITKEQLRYVDYFINENIGLFMPVGGPCFYALAPKHTHPSYMIILPFDDETSLNLNGKTIASKYGEIFILSPNIAHFELKSDFPPRYIAIFIKERFFKNLLTNYPVKSNIIFYGNSYKANPQLLPLLKKFMIEKDTKIPGYESVLNAISIEICHTIIRNIFKLNTACKKISDKIEINRAIEYIYSNFDKKITVEEMAKVACMSLPHFYRIFKTETDETPLEYLNQIRLKTAKKLLKANDKSITEIALECGFSNSAYFSTCFYKKFKITPSVYQKNLKNDSISKKYDRKMKD